MTLTKDCQPYGSGNCDGFHEATQDECSCPCHTMDDLPPTVSEVRGWHDVHHGLVPVEGTEVWAISGYRLGARGVVISEDRLDLGEGPLQPGQCAVLWSAQDGRPERTATSARTLAWVGEDARLTTGPTQPPARCEWDALTDDVRPVRGHLLCKGCRAAVADAARQDILSALDS